MGRYKGQTKLEFEKNFTRVKDIIDKSDGDEDKAIRLAKTQANRITDEHKAINRAMAAKSIKCVGNIHQLLHDVFFERAYILGSVTKQDYREYKFEKLGI